MRRFIAKEDHQDREEVSGTVAFDLDGTLAHHTTFKSISEIGEPIPEAIALLKSYLEKGCKVVIFTARVSGKTPEEIAEAEEARKYIEMWSVTNIGTVLEVTCEKTKDIVIYYDDRARQVKLNTGEVVKES